MADIDSLEIRLTANAKSASSSIDALVKRINGLSLSLQGLKSDNLNKLASGVQQLGIAMQTMNNIKTADFTRLAKNLANLNKVDVSQFETLSKNISRIGQSLGTLSSFPDGTKQLSELANGIKQLGYKSAEKAVENIPKLAVAVRQLMAELSKAPKVSQNLIDMTNALAKLARTGASSGRAANSLFASLNGYSKAAKTAKTHSFNLASAIGKICASYWLVFRGIGKLKEAIDISSQLAEVQNAVDVTFREYSHLVEKMTDTSIIDFGMSEFTAKQIASRFQAMGTAIGFSRGQMAGMSIELTKLTADMASFYDVEQDTVAKSLQAVFTGETEPLRKYGLDLTNATLQEWAMKNGIDANVKSMSQMEKTMLRYQYVMANTDAAQGDFARTADTWANQIRILKQNFESLATVVGGTFINALKPMISALNTAMSYVITFAETVSNALGKIFGWKYESGDGVANDLEAGVSAADDIASGMGDAASNAKKLKDYTLGIDELNVINPDTGSGSGGSSGSGLDGSDASGSGGGQWVKDKSLLDYESELDNLYKLGEFIGEKLTNALEDIDWESIYESASDFGTGLADFLNGLISPDLFGEVGETIASVLNTAIYVALSFGETFDFYDFGASIATGINDFFDTFDFKSLADTLNIWVDGLEDTIAGFLNTVTWDSILAGTKDFLNELELDTVGVIIGAFALKSDVKKLLLTATTTNLVGGITLSKLAITVLNLVPAISSPAFSMFGSWFVGKIEESVSGLLPDWANRLIGNLVAGISIGAIAGSWAPGFGTAAGAIVGALIGALNAIQIDGVGIVTNLCNKIFNFDTTKQFFDEAKKSFDAAFDSETFAEIGKNILKGIMAGFLGAISFVGEPLVDFMDTVSSGLCELFGIHSPATEMEPIGLNIYLGILEGFASEFDEFSNKMSEFWNSYIAPWFSEDKWNEFKDSFFGLGESIVESFTTALNGAQNVWTATSGWFNSEVVIPIGKMFLELKNTIRNLFKLLWSEIQKIWSVATTWFNSIVITPVFSLFNTFKDNIYNLFNNLWLSVQEIWQVVSTWFNETVIVPVQTDFETATNTIGEAFDGLWKGIKTGVINAMNAAISAIESAVNWIIGSINDVIESINDIGDAIEDAIGFDVPSIPKIPKVNLGRIPAYEIGGFPEDGLFMANHTELVGQFSNGKTAVANNEQIVAGIQQGVYEANSEQNDLIREMIGLLQDIRAKDTTVRLNGRDVGKGLDSSSRRQGYKLRTSY